MKIKEVIKTGLKYIITYMSLIMIYVLLLILVCLIPRESIEDNVKESSEILNKETNAFVMETLRGWNVHFDNYTDALMVNTAYSIDNNDAFTSAMFARKNYIPGTTKIIYEDVSGELKSASKYEQLDQVGELNDTVNGDIDESFEYARYWHGYLIWLRPLLLIFNIKQIRILMTVIFIALLIALTVILAKKSNIFYAIAVAVGLIGVDYFYIGLSLQSTPIFLVTMIASIVIAVRGEKIKHIYPMFFIIGSIASFVDFLTVPIITLGLPLTVYFLSLQKQRNVTIEETIKIIALATINWGAGYLLTWLTKWIIVDLIYQRDLIETAIRQVLYRTSENVGNLKWAVARNGIVIKENIIFIAVVSVIATVIRAIVNRKNLNLIKQTLENIFPYVVILLMPFAWYFVLKEHSILHRYFTYRTMLLVLTSMALILLKISEKKKDLVKEGENE